MSSILQTRINKLKKGESPSKSVTKVKEETMPTNKEIVKEVKVDITSDDIVNAMKRAEVNMNGYSVNTLIDTKDLMEKKSSDYGPVGTILDLMGELTGYSHASIPLNEVAALTRTVTKIVRYMTLRGSKKKINYESLTDTTRDLVGETNRLNTACMFNQEDNDKE